MPSQPLPVIDGNLSHADTAATADQEGGEQVLESFWGHGGDRLKREIDQSKVDRKDRNYRILLLVRCNAMIALRLWHNGVE